MSWRSMIPRRGSSQKRGSPFHGSRAQRYRRAAEKHRENVYFSFGRLYLSKRMEDIGLILEEDEEVMLARVEEVSPASPAIGEVRQSELPATKSARLV